MSGGNKRAGAIALIFIVVFWIAMAEIGSAMQQGCGEWPKSVVCAAYSALPRARLR